MAEALEKAIEMFAAAPQSPQSAMAGASGHSPRTKVARDVRNFEEGVSQWRSGMLAVRQGMADMYKSLSEVVPPDVLQGQVRALDEFIEQVDQEIETEWLALERSPFSTRQAVASIMKTSSDNAHFANKLLKRLYKAGIEQHNTRVDFYYFLLALRAEHDPDYKGGPTFENAKDLIADLRNQTR